MRRRPALTLVTASLLFGVAAGHGGDAAGVTVDATTPAWRQQVDWGLARVRAAGLELPPLTITVHEDRAGCNGNAGLYRPGDPAEVHLCSQAEVGSRAARLITLHELAHAWAEAQLGSTERDAFLALRGLHAWIDPGIPPHEWGAEHAAEVVSWGLMDELVPIVRIHDADPGALAAGFELLTGRTPLVPSAGEQAGGTQPVAEAVDP